MINENLKTGAKGELLAVSFLKKNGYKILEKNFRTNLGEIDIIAKDKNVIVFIEVKSRKTANYGNPKWAVTAKKKRAISMVALQYLKKKKKIQAKSRFDVVSIIMENENAFTVSKGGKGTKTEPDIELVKNAFELAYK